MNALDLQEYFYTDMPSLYEFRDITDTYNFVAVPLSWLIIITDIVDSTGHIESGRYKDVNLIGACTIVAMLNIANQIEIPFVFGGDGASILIPSNLLQLAQNALISVQALAQDSFGMELRVGIVPVTKVMGEFDIRVAKLQISANYHQAIFKGGGLTYATQLVKDSDTYQIKRGQKHDLNKDGSANFSGLECRWQDIKGKHGEILSLIVLATTINQSESDFVYKEAIAQIEKSTDQIMNLILLPLTD